MVPAALGTIRPVPHSQSHARRRALRDAEVPWLMTFIGRRPMRASAHKTERL
jgi:transposase InsO family protein